MLNCSMQWGTAKVTGNPHMAKYILGGRSGIHIINPGKTLACLRQAAGVTAEIVSKGDEFLFVGTGEKFKD